MAHVKQRHRGVIAGVLVPLLAGTPLYAAPTAPATSATRTIFSDSNHVGHVVLERDDTGAILGTPHRYSPYGVVLGEDPVPQESPRFGGKLRDPASGLDDVRARHYTHAYGRFLSVDAAQQGGNHYVFGGNNPLKNADPTGTTFRDFVNGIASHPVGSFIGLDTARVGAEFCGRAWGNHGLFSWSGGWRCAVGAVAVGWATVDLIWNALGAGAVFTGVTSTAASFAVRGAVRRGVRPAGMCVTTDPRIWACRILKEEGVWTLDAPYYNSALHDLIDETENAVAVTIGKQIWIKPKYFRDKFVKRHEFTHAKVNQWGLDLVPDQLANGWLRSRSRFVFERYEWLRQFGSAKTFHAVSEVTVLAWEGRGLRAGLRRFPMAYPAEARLLLRHAAGYTLWQANDYLLRERLLPALE